MKIKAVLPAFALASVFAISHNGVVHAQAAPANTNTAQSAQTTQPQTIVTVQPGDTLSSIALSENTTYVRIFDANSQIQNPNIIYPGQQFSIPAASEQLPNRPLPGSAPAEAAATAAPAPAPAPVDSDDEAVTSTPVAPDVSSTPVVTPAPQESTSQPSAAPSTTSTSIWDALAQCESGGNWSIDTGNGFYGGLQFTLSSWDAVGGTGYPNQASPSEQIYRAQLLQAQQGWGAWPVCSVKVGL